MTSAGGELTPSTLLYLFGDQVAPKDKALTEGVEVPCRGVKVQKRPLAAAMFAAAFLGLREQGLVTFEVQQKKVLFVKTKKVVVTRTGTAAGGRPGLEGAVLAGLGSDASATVSEIIRKWFGEDVYSPWSDVIGVAVEEAMGAGCFEAVEVERGRMARKLLGSTKTQPDCERIAKFAVAFDAFHARWKAFESREADLSRELLDDCAGAIKSRVESSDDDFD
jgi:hypothetical protein